MHRSLPTRFVAIDEAVAAFALIANDALRVRSYPNAANWRRCSDPTGVMSRILAAVRDDPCAFISGLPGSGKTFHALLFAYRWLHQLDPRWSWQEKVTRLGYYAAAAPLDPAAVETQWAASSP